MIDKWYKHPAYNNLYIKPKFIRDGYTVVCEAIVNGVWRGSDNSKNSINDFKLLTDLSEIQKYLPEGHPDKIEFKEGEYGFCTHDIWGAKEGYIFLANGSKESIKHINIGTKSFNRHGWNFWTDKDVQNLRKATEEEIKWLNACIEKGQFVSKEEALKSDNDGLLEEARRKYPVGTKFYVAHVNVGEEGISTVLPDEVFEYECVGSGAIVLKKNGKTALNDSKWAKCVYCDGKWAEIVEDNHIKAEPHEIPKSKSDWVTPTTPNLDYLNEYYKEKIAEWNNRAKIQMVSHEMRWGRPSRRGYWSGVDVYDHNPSKVEDISLIEVKRVKSTKS